MIIRLYQTSIGKKYVMAVSGCLLLGFVSVHLLGNLQVFLGTDTINAYAAMLKGNQLLVWTARLVLLTIAMVHITTGLGLAFENRAARPVAYATPIVPYADYSSRTMLLSGLAVFAFVLYHLLHFTVGVTHPEIMQFRDTQDRPDVYRMMILGFSHPAVSGMYILALVLLYLHLNHGISSFFQSLGLKTGIIAILWSVSPAVPPWFCLRDFAPSRWPS